MVQLVRIFDTLPETFSVLRAEACAEGHTHIERLTADWNAETTRFDQDGEALFAAFLGGELAGIGGMTIEPADPGRSRMRRFYVRPGYRHQGVARALAGALMQESAHALRPMTVHAPTVEACAFWVAMGFFTDARHGWTHVWPAVET